VSRSRSRVGAAVGLILVACGVLPSATLTAGAVGTTHDVDDFSLSASPESIWGVTDASLLTPAPVTLQAPVAKTVSGVLTVVGLDAGGHLIDMVADGPGSTWHTTDLTTAAGGPTLTGTQSVIMSPSGQLDVFGIGDGLVSGHLIEFVADGANGRTWNAYDVSSITGRANQVSGPSTMIDDAGRVRVFTQDNAGHVIDFKSWSTTTWTAADLTASYGMPTVTGAPSATLCPGAPGVVCVFGRSWTGHLLEVAANGTFLAPWTARDVTNQLFTGTLAADPTAITVAGRLAVAVVGADGTLALLSSASATFSGATVLNLTARTGTQPDAPQPVSMTSVFGGVALASRATTGDLLVHLSTAGSGFSVASGKNVSASGLATPISTPPSVAVAGGLIHVEAGSAPGVVGRVDSLLNGRSLGSTQSLVSPSGAYRAVMQADGNFVVYGPNGAPLWATGTVTGPGTHVALWGTGEIIVSNAAGTIVWRSGNSSGPTTTLRLRNDGDLIAANASGTIVWSSGTSVAEVIVRTVRSQIGVTESPVGSNCNPYTGFFGRGSAAGCPLFFSSEAWCSDFANWAWLKANAGVSGITAWSYNYVAYGLAHGTFKLGPLSHPQPGDAVVWGNANIAYGTHVGTVVAVFLGYIDVVSGNAGDRVSESGWMNAATSTVSGYSIIGYTSPLPVAAEHGGAPMPAAIQPTAAQINSQDGGR